MSTPFEPVRFDIDEDEYEDGSSLYIEEEEDEEEPIRDLNNLEDQFDYYEGDSIDENDEDEFPPLPEYGQ